MAQKKVDLKKEQAATLARPHYPYSFAARFLFFAMDLVTGKEGSLSKARLLEILASIPYREWEFRQYKRMTRGYRDPKLVEQAEKIVDWGREAQDNEYWHLLVINDKMKADGIKAPWYLSPPVNFLIVLSYVVFARLLAFFSIRRAFLFNAEFEDHAERVYAQFVADHPELEEQPADSLLVKDCEGLASWADVFRRISLDERDHRNNSFIFYGTPEHVIEYEGMPEG